MRTEMMGVQVGKQALRMPWPGLGWIQPHFSEPSIHWHATNPYLGRAEVPNESDGSKVPSQHVAHTRVAGGPADCIDCGLTRDIERVSPRSHDPCRPHLRETHGRRSGGVTYSGTITTDG